MLKYNMILVSSLPNTLLLFQVLQDRNREEPKSAPDNGKFSNDSLKMSSRWDIDYSALSNAYSKRVTSDLTKNPHCSSNSTPVHRDNHSTPTKSGNWITTDSDCKS